MKMSYDPSVDILTVKIAPGRLDHAEEAGDVIVHLSTENRPLLLEILGASRFLRDAERLITRPAA